MIPLFFAHFSSQFTTYFDVATLKSKLRSPLQECNIIVPLDGLEGAKILMSTIFYDFLKF